MLNIPIFMDNDDYLQNPIVKKFCFENGLKVYSTRPDCLKEIKIFADTSQENEEKVREWLRRVAKEGSKEICYREINRIPDEYFNYETIRNVLETAFPNCVFSDVVSYNNTYQRTLINYKITTNEKKEVSIISFCFSSLVLVGDSGNIGEEIAYPVYVDIYLKEKFVFSRAKAKTTIYKYVDEDKRLTSANHIIVSDYAVECIDEVVKKLELECETEVKRAQDRYQKIMYNLYDKFSFTPLEVEKCIQSVTGEITNFVNAVFAMFNLNSKNMQTALTDMAIFIEKFISINGNNEELFKNGRDAYLIKVGADDEAELTSINTSSNWRVPLQCTEAFFDSKKSVMNGHKCKKLSLCFKRQETKYFGKVPFEVQFLTCKSYGVFKTRQYAEEADLNNVLQYFFECAERS